MDNYCHLHVSKYDLVVTSMPFHQLRPLGMSLKNNNILTPLVSDFTQYLLQNAAISHLPKHPIPTRILVTTPHSSARSETKGLRVDSRSLS